MTKRKSYAKLEECYKLPNMLDIQLDSYRDFLQLDIPKAKRKKEGLESAFREIYPLETPDKEYRLDYLSYVIGKPKYSISECKIRGMSFAGALRVMMRLKSKKETKEQEVYLGMCRRWRDVAKPTIALVQGACIAGGLMLAWVCDLIVATEDAFFQDPVLRMGIPGVEYFAHAFELPPRVAKEFLLLGERMSAQRAYGFGMVNRIVAREQLEAEGRAMAANLAEKGRLGLWLTKQAVNHVEELRGKRTAMDTVFHMHHFAHAQSDLVRGNSLGGQDAKSMAEANKRQIEKSAGPSAGEAS